MPHPLRWFEAAAEADWDAVYQSHLPRVYNFFRYRIGITADVEDLTAITFEKAWRARHRYRRDLAGFTTWLMTIARRVATDHYRQQRNAAPIDAAGDMPSMEPNPEQRASVQSDIDRLAGLLAGVPERERELLALKYGGEMTNREIARLTGLSESNVGTILHRTLQDLRGAW